MNKLILIRHGDVEPEYLNEVMVTYGPNAKLSELGHRQAEKIATTLNQEGIKPSALFVSPYTRAIQSAMPIADEFGLPAIYSPQLKDVYCPKWWGVPTSELVEIGGNIYAVEPRSTDQETFEQVVKRASDTLKFIMEGRKNETVAIVSHGDILSAMNWILMREGVPTDYPEMVKNKYLNKGEGIFYTLGEGLSIEGEGRMIITDEAKMSPEGFRGNPERR